MKWYRYCSQEDFRWRGESDERGRKGLHKSPTAPTDLRPFRIRNSDLVLDRREDRVEVAGMCSQAEAQAEVEGPGAAETSMIRADQCQRERIQCDFEEQRLFDTPVQVAHMLRCRNKASTGAFMMSSPGAVQKSHVHAKNGAESASLGCRCNYASENSSAVNPKQVLRY